MFATEIILGKARRNFCLFVSTALLVFLAACSGGGGGGESGASNPVPYLMGGAMQGSAVNPTGKTTTFAGSLPGTDGSGTAARFFGPSGVVAIGSYLYLADTFAVRRVTIATGEVVTIAGASVSGALDGVGMAARFSGLSSIATDGTDLYVSDSSNHTIRKIVIATAEVTTFAGTAGLSGYINGNGVSARFNRPAGITSDGANLYIADTENHVIRKIVIATGEVTTLAGSGNAGINNGTGKAADFVLPVSVATDGSHVFVTEQMFAHIRKIVIATAEVTTFAGQRSNPGAMDGTGTAALFGIRPYLTVVGSRLYVSDASTIRLIDIPSAQVTTIAGSAGLEGHADGVGAAARFRSLEGVAGDGTSLYIADAGNRLIRKMDIATSAVTTLAGSPPGTDGIGPEAVFDMPSGATTDGTNLYVADMSGHTIRKIVIATGEVTTLAGLAGVSGTADGVGSSARFLIPRSITSDGSNLYVVDANRTVRKIVIATGEVSTLAGDPLASPASVDGIGASALFSGLSAITTDNTSLYVVDLNTIRKVVIATGQVTTLVDASAGFFDPWGITTDGTSLFVTDAFNQTVSKVVIATGDVTTIAGAARTRGSADGVGGAARFAFPYGITTDGTNLFVCDTANYSIRKIVIATGEVSTLAGSADSWGAFDGTGAAARFSMLFGINTDGKKLYVTDSGNNVIRAVE